MPMLPVAMAPSRRGARPSSAARAPVAARIAALASAAAAVVMGLVCSDRLFAFTPGIAGPPALSAATAAVGRAPEVSLSAETKAATRRKARSTKVRVSKGGKYRGQVSPKLRALLQSDEYRQIIELLAGLEQQGLLQEFLDKSEAYWKDVNVFELAMEEQKGGGRKIVQTVKKDWPRIWPGALDDERMPAFDKMAAFWRRLDQSRIVDQIMAEILPNLNKKYGDMMADREQQRMMAMSDEERRDEILGRLGRSELVVQFAKLCEGDKEVSSIAPKMAPFVAKFVSILELKVASQTESLGKAVDYGVFGILGLAAVAILLATGIIPSPNFGDDAPPPPVYEPGQAAQPAAGATAVPNESAP